MIIYMREEVDQHFAGYSVPLSHSTPLSKTLNTYKVMTDQQLV